MQVTLFSPRGVSKKMPSRSGGSCDRRTMDAAATLRLDLFGDCARWTANQHNAEYSFCAIVPADVLGEHCG
jgi:hypothetical protein